MRLKRDFNFYFNIFIIVGMVIAVSVVNFFELREPGVQIFKQLIIAVGAVMGVVNTVLSANGNIWTFLFGVIEVSICSYANLDSGNIGQFLQHVLYFLPMQFVGYWQWRKRGAGGKDEQGQTCKVRARRLSHRQWALVGVSFVLGTVVSYFILYWIDLGQFKAGHIASLDRPKLILDASVVVLNIIGQILMSLAFAEQWHIWNLVNVFSILLWTNRLLSPEASGYTVVMLVKYVFYLMNSLNGLRIWLSLSRDPQRHMPEHRGCC